MDIISWNNSYSVGIEKVDLQHKKIFELINNLYRSKDVAELSASIGNTLEEMASYVEYHFETEKSYLQVLPEFKAHEREHWDFTKKTMNLVKQYGQESTEKVLLGIVTFLCEWLNNHILQTDINQFKLLSARETP